VPQRYSGFTGNRYSAFGLGLIASRLAGLSRRRPLLSDFDSTSTQAS
jgi:hypothetical protein